MQLNRIEKEQLHVDIVKRHIWDNLSNLSEFNLFNGDLRHVFPKNSANVLLVFQLNAI